MCLTACWSSQKGSSASYHRASWQSVAHPDLGGKSFLWRGDITGQGEGYKKAGEGRTGQRWGLRTVQAQEGGRDGSH